MVRVRAISVEFRAAVPSDEDSVLEIGVPEGGCPGFGGLGPGYKCWSPGVGFQWRGFGTRETRAGGGCRGSVVWGRVVWVAESGLRVPGFGGQGREVRVAEFGLRVPGFGSMGWVWMPESGWGLL